MASNAGTTGSDTPDVSDEDVKDISIIDNQPVNKPAAGGAEAPAEETSDSKSTTKPEGEAPKEETLKGKTEEAKESEDKAEAKGSEAKEEKPKGEKSQDEAKPEEKPDSKPEPVDPKEQARRAYQQRQKTRQHVSQTIDENYAPKSKEDLINEGVDESRAEIEALRSEMQYEKTRNYIADLNAGLQLDAENVTKEFPVFDPGTKENPNPQYDPEFTSNVEEAYKQAARLQTDEHGIVTNAEVGLYDFYKRMNDIYQRGTSKGSEKGQADALRMLSRAESPGSSPAKTSTGSLDELEEKLGDVVIT